MSSSASRAITIVYSGDVGGEQDIAAAANTASPAAISLITLAAGANTITPPAGTTACTIVPPAGNGTSITLKGVTGDTGVRLHDTDPTSLAIDSGVASFVLTVPAETSVVGLRLFWS